MEAMARIKTFEVLFIQKMCSISLSHSYVFDIENELVWHSDYLTCISTLSLYAYGNYIFCCGTSCFDEICLFG